MIADRQDRSRPPGLSRGTVPWGWVLATCGAGLALAVFESVQRRSLDVPAALLVVALVAFVGIGAAVLRARPAHPIGRLLMVLGLSFLGSWAGDAVSRSGRLEAWGAWAGANLFTVTALSAGLLFLLFPTGRPSSPRWRIVQHLLVGSASVLLVLGLFAAGPIDGFEDHENPVGVLDPSLVQAIGEPAFLGFVLAAVLCLVSLVVRRIRATGVERLQLRAVVWAGSIVVLLPLLESLSGFDAASGVLFPLTTALLGVTIGVAVLRHRIYDVDLLIRRTVAWGLVFAAVSLVYGVGVLLLGQAIGRVAPGTNSDLEVALSTLLAFAAFAPLRRSMVRWTDRIFHRRRVQSDEAIATLSARLRASTSTDELGSDIALAVETAVEPESISVWIAPRLAR